MTGEEAMKEIGAEIIGTGNAIKENFPRKSRLQCKSKTGLPEDPVLYSRTTAKAYSGNNLAMTLRNLMSITCG